MKRNEAKKLCMQLRNQLSGHNGAYQLRNKTLRAIAFSKVEELMDKYVIHCSEIEEKPDLLIFK